ncbi:hypothetical protein ACH34S_17015 [Actinomadura sp. 3N508]
MFQASQTPRGIAHRVRCGREAAVMSVCPVRALIATRPPEL